jgi:hypothetical protein
MSSIHSLSIVRGIPIVIIYLSASFLHGFVDWKRRNGKRPRSRKVGVGEWERRKKGDDVQKITVSAAVKLIPNPPARVERQKTNISGLNISFVLGYWVS